MMKILNYEKKFFKINISNLFTILSHLIMNYYFSVTPDTVLF